MRRPRVDPDHTTTVGLDRDQARAFLAAVDADHGPARLRTAAAARLLECGVVDPRGAGHSERTRAQLREALQAADLLDDLDGYTVRELDDDEEILLAPDGGEITTWRQDYPYEERIDPEEYRARKRALQIELLKMQSWVKDTGRPGLSGVLSARIVRGTQESGGHRQRARGAGEVVAAADACREVATSSAVRSDRGDGAEIVESDRSSRVGAAG